MPDGGSAGFGVLPTDLRSAATSIAAVLEGVSGLDPNGLGDAGPAYGHSGLHAAMTQFCAGMRETVEGLHRSAAACHDNLHATANRYVDVDDRQM